MNNEITQHKASIRKLDGVTADSVAFQRHRVLMEAKTLGVKITCNINLVETAIFEWESNEEVANKIKEVVRTANEMIARERANHLKEESLENAQKALSSYIRLTTEDEGVKSDLVSAVYSAYEDFDLLAERVCPCCIEEHKSRIAFVFNEALVKLLEQNDSEIVKEAVKAIASIEADVDERFPEEEQNSEVR